MQCDNFLLRWMTMRQCYQICMHCTKSVHGTLTYWYRRALAFMGRKKINNQNGSINQEENLCIMTSMEAREVFCNVNRSQSVLLAAHNSSILMPVDDIIAQKETKKSPWFLQRQFSSDFLLNSTTFSHVLKKLCIDLAWFQYVQHFHMNKTCYIRVITVKQRNF